MVLTHSLLFACLLTYKSIIFSKNRTSCVKIVKSCGGAVVLFYFWSDHLFTYGETIKHLPPPSIANTIKKYNGQRGRSDGNLWNYGVSSFFSILFSKNTWKGNTDSISKTHKMKFTGILSIESSPILGIFKHLPFLKSLIWKEWDFFSLKFKRLLA